MSDPHIFSVTTHQIIGCHKNRQFVKRPFGLQLGDDANAGIDDDHESEYGILPGSRYQHHDHRYEDDAIEQGEHVGTHNIGKRS